MFNTFSDLEIQAFHEAGKKCLLAGGGRVTKVQAGNVGSEKEYDIDYGNPQIWGAICREYEKRFEPARSANRRTTVCFS